MFLPQMAPSWWMTLMVMTITMMMMYKMTMYFNSNNSSKMFKTTKKIKLNWKW